MNGNLVIGNLCNLLAMGANAFSSTRKTAKGVLHAQNFGQLMYFITGIVLRGYSAAVQNAVGILRNLTAIWNIKSKILEWILTAAGVILGVVFNNRGLVGLLPVAANFEYTLAIFRFKDNERAIKIAFLISSVSYVIFNIAIRNYVGAACDLTVVITTAVVLVRGKKNKQA